MALKELAETLDPAEIQELMESPERSDLLVLWDHVV